MKVKRIFMIVLDSCGIGELPDAAEFGDVGTNTLKSCFETGVLNVPHMKDMGLFNIDGVDYTDGAVQPCAAYMRCCEASEGKDTTIGHWELAGIVSDKPLPTYPDGFPENIIRQFERAVGRRVICNKPYSGTDVIRDYGEEHIRTGKLIVYTSADSVFQIAAHKSVMSTQELYECCEAARGILCGEHAVGRVIARPFDGEYPNFFRTKGRHDFSLVPPEATMLDYISKAGKKVYSIGKIVDIFAGRGITEYVRTEDNTDGMKKTDIAAREDFEGLCFANLVDFDMVYGHRNDAMGYAKALNSFDEWLGGFCRRMKNDDVLIITADHGCDPSYTVSTDHSREYIPVLIYGNSIKPENYGTRDSYADVGKTVCGMLGVDNTLKGKKIF